MLRKALFLLGPTALLASAFSMVQQDQPAEKVFQNIHSFQGMPAKDLIPSMEYFAASLKAPCTFCHEEGNFASDAKREKRTARKMIAMVKGINETYFGGEMKVSCNSCHNGRNRPLSSPSLDGLSVRHEDMGQAPQPDTVTKKYDAAIGGTLRTLRMDGQQIDGGESTPYVLTQSEDGRFAAQFGPRSVGYDGSQTWFSAGGHTRILNGASGVSVRSSGRSFRGPHAFSGYRSLAVVGKDVVEGKPCVVLRGEVPSEDLAEELYFDLNSGLLLRVATYNNSPFGVYPTLTDYADYRKVGGVLVPFKISTVDSKGSVHVVQFKSGKPNVKVDPKTFSPPN